jgi:hypothetical protein
VRVRRLPKGWQFKPTYGRSFYNTEQVSKKANGITFEDKTFHLLAADKKNLLVDTTFNQLKFNGT